MSLINSLHSTLLYPCPIPATNAKHNNYTNTTHSLIPVPRPPTININTNTTTTSTIRTTPSMIIQSNYAAANVMEPSLRHGATLFDNEKSSFFRKSNMNHPMYVCYSYRVKTMLIQNIIYILICF